MEDNFYRWVWCDEVGGGAGSTCFWLVPNVGVPTVSKHAENIAFWTALGSPSIGDVILIPIPDYLDPTPTGEQSFRCIKLVAITTSLGTNDFIPQTLFDSVGGPYTTYPDCAECLTIPEYEFHVFLERDPGCTGATPFSNKVHYIDSTAINLAVGSAKLLLQSQSSINFYNLVGSPAVGEFVKIQEANCDPSLGCGCGSTSACWEYIGTQLFVGASPNVWPEWTLNGNICENIQGPFVDCASCDTATEDILGCTDSTAQAGWMPDINGHGTAAVYNCAVSTTIPTVTDPCTWPCATGYLASNFNPCATIDDGSCYYETFHQWTDCDTGLLHVNFIPLLATNIPSENQQFFDNIPGGPPAIGETIQVPELGGACWEYEGTSFTVAADGLSESNPAGVTYIAGDCGDCTGTPGCTDIAACNYDVAATYDDGSCCTSVPCTGCKDPGSSNYDPDACFPCDGGTPNDCCLPCVYGCMDSTSLNYNPLATCDNGTCITIVYGCTDPNADNYDPTATVNQVSATDVSNPCLYEDTPCKREKKPDKTDYVIRKIEIECSFADDVYKKYKSLRYGIGNCCGSDYQNHLNEKGLCDWEDGKLPSYLRADLKEEATYDYPIVDGAPNPDDPYKPTWVTELCGLSESQAADCDLYFFYDTSSLGETEVKDAYDATQVWLTGLGFTGNQFHSAQGKERWLDWASCAMTGSWDNYVSPFGSSNMNTNNVTNLPGNIFWQVHQWADVNGVTMYGGKQAGDTGSGTNMNTITLLGPPPASTAKCLLTVIFADEAENGNDGQNPASPSLYHDTGTSVTTIWPKATDGMGTLVDGSDSEVGFTWKGDYNAFVSAYTNWIGQSADHNASFFVYPSKPNTIFSTHKPFPLHVLGAISSGNQTVKDGTFTQGTAPHCSPGMGGANGIGVKMCAIENYVGHVRVNPYYTPIAPNILPPFSSGSPSAYGYGGLDNYGWGTNVSMEPFTEQTFINDLNDFWGSQELECDDSECWYITVVNQNGVAVEDYDIILDGANLGTTDEYGRFHIVIPNASVDTQHILNLCWCLTSEGDCRQQKIKITVTEECPAVCCDDIFDACPPEVIIPEEPILMGCTDPTASNYSSLANVDDGSCMYCGSFIVTEVHTDADLGIDNGTITITAIGGTLPYTYGWSSSWGGFVDPGNVSSATGLGPGVYTIIVMDSEGCTEVITIFISQPLSRYGCMDVCACNYDATANLDDGSCLYAGCIDLTGVNTTYAICADTGLEMTTPAQAPTADCLCIPGGTNTGCCNFCIYGCQDVNAVNYDGAATCDCDGTYMGCTTTSNPACTGPGTGECCEYYWVCESTVYRDSCEWDPVNGATIDDIGGLNMINLVEYSFDNYTPSDTSLMYVTTFSNGLAAGDFREMKWCNTVDHGGSMPPDACECIGPSSSATREHWNQGHADTSGYFVKFGSTFNIKIFNSGGTTLYHSINNPFNTGGDWTWIDVMAGIQDWWTNTIGAPPSSLNFTKNFEQVVTMIQGEGYYLQAQGARTCVCSWVAGAPVNECINSGLLDDGFYSQTQNHSDANPYPGRFREQRFGYYSDSLNNNNGTSWIGENANNYFSWDCDDSSGYDFPKCKEDNPAIIPSGNTECGSFTGHMQGNHSGGGNCGATILGTVMPNNWCAAMTAWSNSSCGGCYNPKWPSWSSGVDNFISWANSTGVLSGLGLPNFNATDTYWDLFGYPLDGTTYTWGSTYLNHPLSTNTSWGPNGIDLTTHWGKYWIAAAHPNPPSATWPIMRTYSGMKELDGWCICEESICDCVEDPTKASGGPYHVDEDACNLDASNCCGECGCTDGEDYTGGSLFALNPDINGCDALGNCGRTGPGGAGPYCTSDGLAYDCVAPTNTPTGYVRCNYDPTAQCDDGSCFTCGCMNPSDPCYNNLATVDDGSCEKWKCEPGTFTGTNDCATKTQMFWNNDPSDPVMWNTTVQNTGPPYCGMDLATMTPATAAGNCSAEWFFETGNGTKTFNQYFYLDNTITPTNPCWDPTYPSYIQSYLVWIEVPSTSSFATGQKTTADGFRTAIINAGLSNVTMTDDLPTIKQKLFNESGEHAITLTSSCLCYSGSWTPCTCITDPAGTYNSQSECFNPTIPNCCQSSWQCNVEPWKSGSGSSALPHNGCHPDTVNSQGLNPKDWSTMDVSGNYFPNPAAVPDTWATSVNHGGLIDSTITAPVTYHTGGGPMWIDAANSATVTASLIWKTIAHPANGLQHMEIGGNYFWSETPDADGSPESLNMKDNTCEASVAQINSMMYPAGSGITGPAFTSSTLYARKDQLTRIALSQGTTFLTSANGTWANLINHLQLNEGFDGATHPLIDLNMDFDTVVNIMLTAEPTFRLLLGTTDCGCCTGSVYSNNCPNVLQFNCKEDLYPVIGDPTCLDCRNNNTNCSSCI